jgi:hypothetical protein
MDRELVSTNNGMIASYITERFPKLMKLAPGTEANGAGLAGGYLASARFVSLVFFMVSCSESQKRPAARPRLRIASRG